ncbi:MAG TPA: hypothetical protein VK923_19965 [Euzebyales bacterium]|nr:hypothetical protein [Euzebyales bacterium]
MLAVCLGSVSVSQREHAVGVVDGNQAGHRVLPAGQRAGLVEHTTWTVRIRSSASRSVISMPLRADFAVEIDVMSGMPPRARVGRR